MNRVARDLIDAMAMAVDDVDSSDVKALVAAATDPPRSALVFSLTADATGSVPSNGLNAFIPSTVLTALTALTAVPNTITSADLVIAMAQRMMSLSQSARRQTHVTSVIPVIPAGSSAAGSLSNQYRHRRTRSSQDGSGGDGGDDGTPPLSSHKRLCEEASAVLQRRRANDEQVHTSYAALQQNLDDQTLIIDRCRGARDVSRDASETARQIADDADDVAEVDGRALAVALEIMHDMQRSLVELKAVKDGM